MKLERNHLLYVIAGVIVLVLLANLAPRSQQVASSPRAESGTSILSPAPMADFAEVEEAFDSARIIDRDTSAADDVDAAEAHIIKTASIDMLVDNADEATLSLNTIAKSYLGSVQSQSLTARNGVLGGYVSLRVVSEHFDAAVSDIQEIAEEVLSISIDTDDVTAQVIDTEARLHNARAEEESYLLILQKATDVQDILSVQSYLSRTRDTIERYVAQLENLGTQTEYSHLTVYLEEEARGGTIQNRFRPDQDVEDAFDLVIRKAEEIFSSAITITIIGSFLLIPLAILALIISHFTHRKSRYGSKKKTK
jgi:hypothetical protein